MRNIVKGVFLIALMMTTGLLTGQKSLKKQAESLFKKAHYYEVIKSLEQYNNIDREQAVLQILADSYRLTNNQPKAVEKYFSCIDLVPESIENYYKIAKCYDEMGKYDEAVKYYKTYLTEELDKKNYYYNEAIKNIKRIGQSKKIKFQPQIAFVENAGIGVNSIYDERKVIQSRHIQSRFYFISNRKVSLDGMVSGNLDNTDIYVFETNNGTIVNDEITAQYNTDQAEILEEINADGTAIIYQTNKSINIDTFNIEGNRMTSQFISPYNPSRGDRDLKMFNDSTLVFASTYYSGYGGYDIFVSKKNESGSWEEPINLGNVVNTIYDELSPYFTKGGNTLFFSSNKINSIGGFDIYASQYSSNGWSKEVNLGLPINSTKDDLAGIITNDGSQLYFSSDRIGSNGGYDIYIAYLKEQINDQLMYSEKLPIFNQEASNDSASIANAPQGEELLKVEVPKSKARTFINQILYYKDDADILSIANMNLLKNIKSIYEIYPELKISVVAHSGIDNEKSLALFFGLKRTETINEELIKMGVNPSALTQSSYGVSFPGTYEKTRYNTRIEFILSGAEKNNLTVVNEEVNLNADVKHLAYDEYSQNKGKLIFKLKVAETFQMLRSNEILTLPKMSIHREKSLYEYYTGYTTTYNEARIIYQDLLTKGFDQVEIVPFISHIKISKEAAEMLSPQYPELIQYLGK